MAEESKTRIEIRFTDLDRKVKKKPYHVGPEYPLFDTQEKIILPLTPEQEAFIRKRLEQVGKTEENFRTPGNEYSEKLLKIELSLLTKDHNGDGYAIAYGANTDIPTTAKASVEVLDGKCTAEDAALAVSP